MLAASVICLLAVACSAWACDDCYGPQNDVVLTRNVRRMQPEAQNATTQPRSPLEWGQINFLHTTDTHGWLEGHLKEQNYGADWGDFVSFSQHMKQKASGLGVDLLLIDTGDLHDGAGLSDATSPNGVLSNPIFENVDYDLLTIGNHELYIAEIAYETFSNFSKIYGDKYITSNVEIINPATGQFEYIGSQYHYFTTVHGLHIMAFGVLYDFTGNSNVSRVTTAADLVKQQWFLDAVNFNQTIDLFLVMGHNPPRPTNTASTIGTIFKTIRGLKPNTPVQMFGGHTHVRDFVVYDDKATGIESGRYCETLGWVSMSGINSSTYNGTVQPQGVPHPSQPAVVVKTANSTTKTTQSQSPSSDGALTPENTSAESLLYSRRYLDWNRLTFTYHSADSQSTFNTGVGLQVSGNITTDRKALNLSNLYGCAPQTYCQSCQPFGAPGNIFTLLSTALSTVVVNQSRADIPRLIIINTGSVRFDLVQGPFTYDDSFIVSPFTDGFQFLPDVPYSLASQVLGILDSGPFEKRDHGDHWDQQGSGQNIGGSDTVYVIPPVITRDTERTFDKRGHGDDWGQQGSGQDNGGSDTVYVIPSVFIKRAIDPCLDPAVTHDHLNARSYAGGRTLRRQSTALLPGYTTTDDFGTDGDDTPHSSIPFYDSPNDLQANASFPTNGSMPQTVDLVFLDFIAGDVVKALNGIGGKYSNSDASYYLPPTFTTNSYLPAYAKLAWQANVPNCPVGEGVGS